MNSPARVIVTLAIWIATVLFASLVLATADTRGALSRDPLRPRVAPAKPAHVELPAGVSHDRLHVKFREGTRVRLRAGRLISLGHDDLSGFDRVVASHPAMRIERLFRRPEEVMDREKERIEARSRREQADLNLYYRLTVHPETSLQALIADLNALDIVELAYPEPLPAPSPALPVRHPMQATARALDATPDFRPLQYYLSPRPIGIDALFAWEQPGGRGAGVRLADVEYSWNQTHEDLSKAAGALVRNGTPVDPFNDADHGTASLGVIVADENGLGVTGIAADVGLLLINSYNSEAGWDLAHALDIARAALNEGDVLLIEQQTPGPNGCDPVTQLGCVAVEWTPAVYDAIVRATSEGVVVVEPAGNGSQNLDNALLYGSPFPAGRPDSGAIMIGAGAAAPECDNLPARARLPFSTYGARLDVQGWGECVVTTGYGLLQQGSTPDADYTDDFSGTSSGSAIVSGAAGALSGIMKERGITVTSTQMRQWMKQTGVPQDTTSPGALSGNIGPLPSLREALAIPLTPFPVWHTEGDQAETLGYPAYGSALAPAGDVNGDGYADVLVGNPYFDGALQDEGAVFLFLGSPWGLSPTPDWLIEGEQLNAHLGAAVAGAGDVNGDGFDDVIVGAPGRTGGGQAFVWYGSPQALGAPGTLATADWVATGSVGGGHGQMGFAVGSAGDVNGDGYADIIVGASLGSGEVFVWHGGAGGLVAGGGNRDNADWLATSQQGSMQFGAAVATAGDVNGDGFSDILIGAPGYTNGSIQGAEGGAFIWLGGASGLGVPGSISNDGATTNAAWKCESNQANAWMGTAVASGDLNGDGFGDVVAGAPRYNITFDDGCALVWFGSATGPGENGHPGNEDWLLCGADGQAQFGQSVSTLDANHDNYADLLVGIPASGLLLEGRACLYSGAATGPALQPAWCAGNGEADDRFGFAVSAAGDVNGDGAEDAIVGAPRSDHLETDEGSADLFYGMPSISDGDGDGASPSQGDCNDRDSDVWGRPSEVTSLDFIDPETTLGWTAPAIVGSLAAPTYDTIRSTNPADYVVAGVCLESDDGSDNTVADPETPPVGGGFFYVVAARNPCSRGPLGTRSDGTAIRARFCP